MELFRFLELREGSGVEYPGSGLRKGEHYRA